ncbi:MAG: hypothetical protein PVF17_00150 [Ignavibacteria bacterium]|jgi:hypothetical protein
MTVNAYDENGRIFPKKVVVDNTSEYGSIIDFGWPCRYYIKDILYNSPKIGDRICIDAAGRNHRDSSVYIDWTQELLDLVKEYK